MHALLYKYKKEFLFCFFLVQLIVLIINFHQSVVLYLFFANAVFFIYLSIKNIYIQIITMALSAVLLGFLLKGEMNLFSNPLYIESINQFRGADDSIIGKLFYNKLLYIYFYLRNVSVLFDLFFWIERIGVITVVFFVVSLFGVIKQLSIKSLIMLGIVLIPFGLIDLFKTSLYIVFLPIISFCIAKLYESVNKRFRLIMIIIFIIGGLVQFLWPVKILL